MARNCLSAVELLDLPSDISQNPHPKSLFPILHPKVFCPRLKRVNIKSNVACLVATCSRRIVDRAFTMGFGFNEVFASIIFIWMWCVMDWGDKNIILAHSYDTLPIPGPKSRNRQLEKPAPPNKRKTSPPQQNLQIWDFWFGTISDRFGDINLFIVIIYICS